MVSIWEKAQKTETANGFLLDMVNESKLVVSNKQPSKQNKISPLSR